MAVSVPIHSVYFKKPRSLGAVMSWRGFARKACVVKKLRILIKTG